MLQFLRLVRYLIMYGFMGSNEELQQIRPFIIKLINGRDDVPFPPDAGVGGSRFCILPFLEDIRQEPERSCGLGFWVFSAYVCPCVCVCGCECVCVCVSVCVSECVSVCVSA